MTSLEDIKALLGEPRFAWSDPEPWSQLEGELGIVFPEDFREFCDAYGPVLINNQVAISHPGVERGKLGDWIRGDIEAWADAPENESSYSVGTGPGEIFAWGSAASGETMFLRVPKDMSENWETVVYQSDDGIFEEHPMSFSDWMLSYLRGEDVTVCSRNFAPDGPFYEPIV
jgi:hypothetical protein